MWRLAPQGSGACLGAFGKMFGIDCSRFLCLPHPLPLLYIFRTPSRFRFLRVSFWKRLLRKLTKWGEKVFVAMFWFGWSFYVEETTPLKSCLHPFRRHSGNWKHHFLVNGLFALITSFHFVRLSFACLKVNRFSKKDKRWIHVIFVFLATGSCKFFSLASRHFIIFQVVVCNWFPEQF